VTNQLKNIEPWRKFPDALLIDEMLSLSAKIIWIVIGTFSPYEEPCRASGRRIGARIGLEKSQTNNLISTLIKHGWASRNDDGDIVRHIPDYAVENLRKWEQNNRVKIAPSQGAKSTPKNDLKTGVKPTDLSDHPTDLSDRSKLEATDLSDRTDRSELSHRPISVTAPTDLSDRTYIDKRIEIKERDNIIEGDNSFESSREEEKTPHAKGQKKKPKKKTETIVKKWSETDWQFEAGSGLFYGLKSLGYLTSETERNEDAEIQAWAEEIDKLNRIDGHSQDTIFKVCNWVLRDWWAESGNFRSARKFRKRDRSGDKYFDVFLIRMKSNASAKAKKQRPTAEQIFNDTRAAFEALGESA